MSVQTFKQYPTQWAANRAGYFKQFEYFIDLYNRIRNVPGDVVECGLGHGGSFIMLAYLAGREDNLHSRTLRGFDSFEGWPEPDESDRSWRNPEKGDWTVTREYFEGNVEESGVRKAFPNLPIVITPGFLGNTLPVEQEQGYRIAFLHLDVDLYPSYRVGLENLFPLVAPGGIVCFDEYREFHVGKDGEKWPGATKAIDEYLKPRGYNLEYYPLTKKYFVIKK